jgi:hypothetical protein
MTNLSIPVVVEGIWRETGSVGSSANNPNNFDLFVKYPSSKVSQANTLAGIRYTCGSLQSAGALMMYLAQASSGAGFGAWTFTVTQRGSASYELVLTTN